jgi:hypothetical protein
MASPALASLAVALVMSQAAPAPQKPDFSGMWTMDHTRSQTGQPSESIRLNIKQTATEISIETTRGDKSWVRTYPIDRSPTPSARGDLAKSRAYWDGTKLVTEGSGNVQDKTVSTRETRQLNPAGTEMIVESILVIQHGYSLKDSKNYGTAKDVFVRDKLP